MTKQEVRFWLGVVSQQHVACGVEGGFAQLCHGKSAPLRRMRAGDWLIYYSPATEMRGGERLQAFTALGQVVDERVYEHDMGGGFVPHRRDVRYEAVRAVPIAALVGELHLTAQPSWGMALRRGHLPLDEHDFALIAGLMRADQARADQARAGQARADQARPGQVRAGRRAQEAPRASAAASTARS